MKPKPDKLDAVIASMVDPRVYANRLNVYQARSEVARLITALNKIGAEFCGDNSDGTTASNMFVIASEATLEVGKHMIELDKMKPTVKYQTVWIDPKEEVEVTPETTISDGYVQTIVRCTCEEFKKAQESGTDNEHYSSLIKEMYSVWYFNTTLPELTFCPWCGKRVPEIEE